MKLYQRLLVIGLSASILAACSSSKPDYSNVPEPDLYTRAQTEMEQGMLKSSTKLLEEMDKIYPFGPYSQQVQLNLIYSYYKSSDLSLAVASIDRFLKLNPTHPNIDWVIYMRGLSNMILDDNQIQGWFGVDRSDRDQDYAVAAFKDFSYLITNFPNSSYGYDAQKRLLFLKNRLSKYQYKVAEYYTKRGAYAAVINRVDNMLKLYPDTQATRNALPLMEKAYRKLGLINEANNVQKIIAANPK
ncbi:outer membrane protein assembly factor BamD [Utexia brackfieldae]|uniref:outer membrane protein assembly factor BamD n=1 Tax=Utexia brackfieldae TaxID=3074108 RepID=UPI00370D0CDC